MKKTRIFYWIVTGLFLLMMLFSGISSLVSGPKAVEFFKMLELPAYLISFLSVAKILGVIVVLIPGFPRLKEWAYAGLMFDLIGAAWCNYSVAKSFGEWSPILIFVALGFLSYYLYHKISATQTR
jgi:DoxX-like family